MADVFPALSPLSPSKQNARPSPVKAQTPYMASFDCDLENTNLTLSKPNFIHSTSPTSSPYSQPRPNTSVSLSSPTKNGFTPAVQQPSSHRRSPLKYRCQDDMSAINSPPDSPARSTIQIGEDLFRTNKIMDHSDIQENITVDNTTAINEDMSTIHQSNSNNHTLHDDDTIDLDATMSLDGQRNPNETFGDLSAISAVPADLTRFANLPNSPIKTSPLDGPTPRANRYSIALSTPATGQRPLQLLSRRSTSSNEDEDATPKVSHQFEESPTDLLNFTGQTNILLPPPASAPRTTKRSPSGRGAFPIRVHPTPSHRSQASVDRERASGRSPQKMFPDQGVPATPATNRMSMPPTTSSGFGLDLLDIDLGPMATPRSIPTITPRELESLRSELQSRISGLEATLSGKEAEVLALKRSVTDAEIRAGKASEDLRTESLEKQDLQIQKDELDRRVREMEEVLREVKQNAFVEEREREKLRRQAEEADRRTEECEVKILELNASLETLRLDRVRNFQSPSRESLDVPSTPGGSETVDVDGAVKNATETVARELHVLYKSKHERKVTDLKLSYEKRWIKQVDTLRAELKQSQEEIARLLAERDSNMGVPVTPTGHTEALSKMEGQIEELRRWNEDVAAQKKLIDAELTGVKSELDTMKRENETLRVDLESERVEKGELVAQVEVFLTVSAEQELEREREKEAREARDRERQPVSPPRSDASGESNVSNGNGWSGNNGINNLTAAQTQSPNKARMMNGGIGVNGRPRPMSMLVKPTASKYGSGIPGPGLSGLKAPTANGAGVRTGGAYGVGRSTLMDGIARMGAGSR